MTDRPAPHEAEMEQARELLGKLGFYMPSKEVQHVQTLAAVLTAAHQRGVDAGRREAAAVLRAKAARWRLPTTTHPDRDDMAREMDYMATQVEAVPAPSAAVTCSRCGKALDMEATAGVHSCIPSAAPQPFICDLCGPKDDLYRARVESFKRAAFAEAARMAREHAVGPAKGLMESLARTLDACAQGQDEQRTEVPTTAPLCDEVSVAGSRCTLLDGHRTFHRWEAEPPSVPRTESSAVGSGRASASVHDWPEDAALENGNYRNRCCECGAEFTGHKRRVMCRACRHPDWCQECGWAEGAHRPDCPRHPDATAADVAGDMLGLPAGETMEERVRASGVEKAGP